MAYSLADIDGDFFLGLYRCAIREYQPKIECRTGIKLGRIDIRDAGHYENDFMQYLLSVLPGGFGNGQVVQKWREHLQATRQERFNRSSLFYYRNAIYASFAKGTKKHEVGIAFGVVHELSHALWERLADCLLHPRPQMSGDEGKRFKLLVEGFATYAELVWFADFYPSTVRDYASIRQRQQSGVYYEGLVRVEQLVEEYGSTVLYEIPKRWRDF